MALISELMDVWMAEMDGFAAIAAIGAKNGPLRITSRSLR